MKKFLPIVMCYVLAAVGAKAQNDTICELKGEKAVVDGLNYLIDKETHEAIVDNGNSWTGELSIPSEVTVGGETYIVTWLAWMAFDGCETLTKVTIPKTVKGIASVSINAEAYKNPFNRCTALEDIDVEEGCEGFCSIGGVMFTRDKTMLCSYPAGNKADSYVVPEGVKRIGGTSFAYNEHIVSVELPETVEMIDDAFTYCNKLERVNLPEKITSICASTFRYCSHLKSIVIPQGVRSIGEYTFEGCSSLKVIDLPASLTFIGGYAFKGCALEALVIRGIIDNYLSGGALSGLDESTVLYVQESEINRYKAIFHGTVLPLESYQEPYYAVQSMTIPTTGASKGIYDLQGRRLSAMPQKGVYIQNGKKIIVI